MAHIGIDLGTSNALVAHVTPAGTVEILEIDGVTAVPSVVAIEEEGGLMHFGGVAHQVWENAAQDPRNTFRRWKLQMGDNVVLRTLQPGGARGDTLNITPEYLTSRFVEHLVQQVSVGLGSTPVESVLATVPHGWRRLTPEKCRATREAVALARPNGLPLRVEEYTLSEPVAAAAYYLWEHERAAGAEAREALTGEHLLVCDVGGGTFDLSFIRLGHPGAPLDVIFGDNSNFAGDYADALLCAWVGRQFDADGGADHPCSAEEVLEDITAAEPQWPFLREWFGRVRETKHKLSNAGRAVGESKVKPVSDTFTGYDSRHLRLSIGVPELDEALGPFYERGRELLRRFLQQLHGARPWASVFCGGGSQVLGFRERIVEPVLKEAYGAAAARDILSRITLPRRVDHAIAAGAALVANGLVKIQEHIQHDVGLVFEISDPGLARELGLSLGDSFLLTPILSRGVPLPHVATNDTTGFQGIPFIMPPGETVSVQLVVEDDPNDPWLQPFVITSPARGRRQELTWAMEADRDGVITIRLRTADGSSAEVVGRLERGKRAGTGLPQINRPIGSSWSRRIPPEWVKAALDKLLAGHGR